MGSGDIERDEEDSVGVMVCVAEPVPARREGEPAVWRGARRLREPELDELDVFAMFRRSDEDEGVVEGVGIILVLGGEGSAYPTSIGGGVRQRNHAE